MKSLVKMFMKHSFKDSTSLVLVFFAISSLLVLCMVGIGGITRLTGSGLSITEWKPITGATPPLSEVEWLVQFAKYKSSPEFIKVNYEMSLSEFKNIYMIEYFHRNAARVLALFLFLGGSFLLLSNKLSKQLSITILFCWVLVAAQGVMGWYMVKSGLVDDPHVSHFRLSAHLFLALALYIITFNQATSIYYKQSFWGGFSYCQIMIIFLITMQIIAGGLVAGLKAGLVYNSFPLMGESFIPEEIFTQSKYNYLHDSAIVQFIHRIAGYIVGFFVLYFSIDLIARGRIYTGIFTLATVLTQIYLGIYTLVHHVPIFSALLHQIVAFILIGSIILSKKINNHNL